MKILITAHSCNPNHGSEPGVGWHWVKELSKQHQLWVITRPGSKSGLRDLEEKIRAIGGMPNTKFIFVAEPFLYWLWPVLGGIAGWPGYFGWQWRAYRKARQLHRDIEFDVAWNLTYSSWRAPSFLWKLHIPFIWGPIGGGQDVPKGFRKALGWRGWFKEQIRHLAQGYSRFDPLLRLTMRHAQVILCANTFTKQKIAKKYWPKCSIELETGIDAAQISLPESRQAGSQLNILWVGNLTPTKGLKILLWALAEIRDRIDFKLKIIGDGPDRRACGKIATKGHIARHIEFAGRLPYENVQEAYQRADVLVFTSLRDTSGNAVLEAMSKALPVIVMNWGGPAEMVDSAAYKLPADQGLEMAILSLANKLVELFHDREQLAGMGQRGFEHVKARHMWLHKQDVIQQVFAAIRPGAGKAKNHVDYSDFKNKRLLHLTCIIAPSRVPVFNKLKRMTAEFCVLISGEEDNRIWKLPEQVEFPVKKSWGITIPYWKKSAGHDKYDRKYLHFNPGYLIDLIRFNPDMVLSAEMGFRTLVAWIYCTITRKSLCVWWGGTFHTERSISKFKAIVRQYFFAKIIPCWLSYGSTSTDYLLSLGIKKSKIHEGQNCVDKMHFGKPTIPLIHRGSKPVFLYIGQFVPRKGVHQLLRACQVLNEKGYDFSLLLVGAGYEKMSLEQLAAEILPKNAMFHPFVNYDELPAIYQSADILVFPTLEDVWGLVVNEALAAGLPVLCSKYAGCAKDLIPEKWQFDPLDLDASFVPKMEKAISWGRSGRRHFIRVEAMKDAADLAEAILACFARTQK